jgi:hypothetical protein
MSDLVKTPIIDKNGKSTFVHRSVSKVPATRSLPLAPSGYHDGIDYSDYIANVWRGDNASFSQQEIDSAKLEMRQYAADVALMMDDDPDWLPEVYSSTGDGDEDGLIQSMNELSVADNSRGMCVGVSEAVTQYMKSREGTDVLSVQGMPEPHPELNVHYANLFASDGEPALIVDFTYSQVDENADFPLVLTPEEWVARIQDDLARLDARNAAHEERRFVE